MLLTFSLQFILKLIGACKFLEDLLGKPLMWFPCLHHILELVLGGIIQSRWKTNGPRDAIYTRFADEWPGILSKMKEVKEKAGEKVALVAPEDELTHELHAHLVELLAALQPAKWATEKESVEEEEEENEQENGDGITVEMESEAMQQNPEMPQQQPEMPQQQPEMPQKQPEMPQQHASQHPGPSANPDPDEMKKKIPRGDYFEFVRLVSVWNLFDIFDSYKLQLNLQ